MADNPINGTLHAGGFSNCNLPLETAKLAGYQSAQPNKIQAPASYNGNSPNSPYSQIQRNQLMLEGQNAIKNTPFGINYIFKRTMYCSAEATWSPNTGDEEVNAKVMDYLNECFETMGFNCSLWDAYGRVSDCFLPQDGDAALRIVRTPEGMKVEEITADRIGERFAYIQGAQKVTSIALSNGSTLEGDFRYFMGIYFSGMVAVAYKVYERIGDLSYTNPRNYPASDIIFFTDDLMGGVRGVSKFAIALIAVNSRYQILRSTMDTMQQQSKIAAIGTNNSGSANELTYDTHVNQDGSITYQEHYEDGSVVKFQYTGDTYTVLKAEHPTTAFLEGMKYLDSDGCQAVGFPYEFLFTPKDSGGAPSRFSYSVANREITRLRRRVHAPRFRKIVRLAILQGVQQGKLPAHPEIMRGSCSWGTLPSADAFRDSQSDIKEDRAGFTDKNTVCLRNDGVTYDIVLRRRKTEVFMRKKALKELNDELKAAGCEPDATDDDLAMIADSPKQNPADAAPPEEGKIKPMPSASAA